MSIRLFNGEVIKAQFNYSQTLRDIYMYVRRISGSIKFHLLDGFPPKPLRDYDRTIYELGLNNINPLNISLLYFVVIVCFIIIDFSEIIFHIITKNDVSHVIK